MRKAIVISHISPELANDPSMYTVYGPFKNENEAVRWATKHCNKNAWYWQTLNKPQE